ncbi:hypothetical protein EDD16DRAFT_1650381 [Pisolithus croceorrhizus]|nr:hypothetical protein EDD16DRAFT_1650381 [Pisolithus croceorrhizus]KAI6114689.1 hypothetical protein EV401DRAFT_1979861 [Pisolithus croceorrhizus]KAI6159195.1 hypothetical protein EDD17DRAFT_1614559 [Pisolithus thermaeus]
MRILHSEMVRDGKVSMLHSVVLLFFFGVNLMAGPTLKLCWSFIATWQSPAFTTVPVTFGLHTFVSFLSKPLLINYLPKMLLSLIHLHAVR